MHKVKWSDISKLRIIEIADFIALDAPDAADKWIEKILSKEDILKDNPKIGRIVPEIKDTSIRELIVGEYRLIYEISEKEIIVLTLINCKEQRYFMN